MKFSTLLPLVALAVASRSLGVAADEEVEEEVAVAGPDYCSADPDLSCFLGGVPFCCGFDASLCPEEIPSCEVQPECADIQAAWVDCVGTRLGAGDPICDSWAREGEWFISDNWDALKGDTCFESWTNTCVRGAVGGDPDPAAGCCEDIIIDYMNCYVSDVEPKLACDIPFTGCYGPPPSASSMAVTSTALLALAGAAALLNVA